LSEMLALEIVAVFAIMFVGIVVIVLWFTYASSKVQSNKELKKRKMEILDKHFKELIRIECPYCKTLYSTEKLECPNCGADTNKILFLKIPE